MKIESPHLGEIIEALVKKRGLKDVEFARMLGIRKQNLRKQIYSKHGMDSDVLCKISEVLDCNIFEYLQVEGANQNKAKASHDVKASISIEVGDAKLEKTFHFILEE